VSYNVVTRTPQRLFGIDEASERTGLSAWRIYSEIAAMRLPCKRVGRRIYFSEADILEYLQRIQQNGAT
jgi:excisionase family DNA binding protein